MNIENLSYAEKVELFKKLQDDGIGGACRTEKRALITTLIGSECKEEICKAIINLVDMMTVNYTYEKRRGEVRKNIYLPIGDEQNKYKEIAKVIVNALAPYMKESLDKWKNFEDGLERCDDCQYFNKHFNKCEKRQVNRTFGKIEVACYRKFKE